MRTKKYYNEYISTVSSVLKVSHKELQSGGGSVSEGVDISESFYLEISADHNSRRHKLTISHKTWAHFQTHKITLN